MEMCFACEHHGMMSNLKAPVVGDENRFYTRGDYGKMPAPPQNAGRNTNLKIENVTTTHEHSSENSKQTANFQDASIALTSKPDVKPIIKPIAKPHGKIIDFVDSTLAHEIVQVHHDPKKKKEVEETTARAALEKSVAFNKRADKLIAANAEIFDAIAVSSLDCAEVGMKAIEENTSFDFFQPLEDHDKKEITKIEDLFFSSEKNFGNSNFERHFGKPELSCRSVVSRAMEASFEFAQKIAAYDPKRADLLFFNEEHVAIEAAKAALEAYHTCYVENFPTVAREYPDLKFEPVSGIEFAKPTLETKAIFVESKVDALARNVAQDAAIKIIAGFWQGAMDAATIASR